MTVSRPRRSPTPARLALPRAVTACAVAATALAGCSGPDPATSAPDGVRGVRRVAPAAPAAGVALQNDYEQAVRNVLPSVVQITSNGNLGSGIVYDTGGDIVTNAHVVGGARAFDVSLATGGATLRARLVGGYPADDLAVIRLVHPPSDLHPATFGDSTKVQVGQITLAMGNPLGLSGSVTEGIVSAVGRTVSEGASSGGTGATIPNMVQTSAAINPGNSGGALVNLSSQVIGIPTLAAAEPEMGGGTAPGIGFAIPVSTVTRIADQLIRYGKVTSSGRAGLGITARTVLGPDAQPAGVAVVSVRKGGGADRAGLRPGDVITKIAGQPVPTNVALATLLTGYKPGDKVPVTYDRDGHTDTVTVTLGQL